MSALVRITAYAVPDIQVALLTPNKKKLEIILFPRALSCVSVYDCCRSHACPSNVSRQEIQPHRPLPLHHDVPGHRRRRSKKRAYRTVGKRKGETGSAPSSFRSFHSPRRSGRKPRRSPRKGALALRAPPPYRNAPASRTSCS